MTSEAPEETSLPSVVDACFAIQIEADATTGYAGVQNSIPIVRAIVIKNVSEETLRGVEVKVNCSPAFAMGASFLFERLAPGESRTISPVDLRPDHTYLIKLDEAEKASINVEASLDGASVECTSATIEVLAYDQWAGTRSLPELLAAFAMPNSVAVDRLLSKASGLLREGTGGLSMNGYQSKNRENVWKQASAIYSALLAEGFHYANPPASFGADGQKIRTPERVFDGRVATCLDLTMLFASCFEQAGLHSVVLFKEGHAWVGVWLIETSFPIAIVDDVQAIRKRVKSGELLVLEATGITNADRPSLRWARSKAGEYLDEDAGFHYAVDINRARELQIRALPSRSNAATSQAEHIVTPVSGIEDMPDLPPLDPEFLPTAEIGNDDTPDGRLVKWKSKLLDLTLRNRLLNLKPTKTSLKLVCPAPAALEDSLSDGKEFKLKAAPNVMEGQDHRDAAVFANRTGKRPLDALAEEALARRELVVEVADEKLNDRLTEIFRAAEACKNEGGANTLFLAFGLLQWKEDKNAEVSHLAPILLIPVTLTRQSIRSGFRLARHDDDAIVNPTLCQKLLNDFELKLPSFDILPTDEKGVDVEKIFQTFRLQIAELEGWEVKEQVHLGIFSFTKYLMWKDLQDRQTQLQENAVVSHLINSPGRAFSDQDLGIETTTLDEKFQPQDLFAPMLSDSSQLRAICAASQGSHLVLEGPPGTGKSQTITNLICHLLSTGKTVLFVSEKMAALEVVHRRLKSLGLGPFCLELHSAKAKKSEVLSQLDSALHATGSRTVKDWELEAERLAGLRQNLNTVVYALHRPHPNDLTIYDAIGTSIKWSHWEAAPLEWASADQHSRKELDGLRTLVREMAALAGQLSELCSHSLSAIRRTVWTPSWQQEFLTGAASLSAAAQADQELLAPFVRLFGLDETVFSWAEHGFADRLADILLRASTVPIGVASSATDEIARTRLKMAREYGLRRQAVWSAFGGRYKDDLARLRAADIATQWFEANSAWWPKCWFAKRADLKRLSYFTVDGRPPAESDIPALIAGLKQVNEEDQALAAIQTDVSVLLQEEFQAHKTDWAVVEAHEKWAKDYADTLIGLSGGDLTRLAMLKAKLLPYVTENRGMLRGDGVLGASLVRYRNAHRKLVGEMHRVSELCGAPGSLIQELHAPGAIQRLLAELQGWQVSQRQIQPWCLWQSSRDRAIADGLQGIVNAIEVGKVTLSDMGDFFEYSYQNWWLNRAIDGEPVLCAFSSAAHELRIKEFRASDACFQELTKQYVAVKLSGQMPSSMAGEAGSDSEMGRLRREIQKKSKHLPIRQLVQRLPTLLPKLKPCLLMSPLSVAQYLEAGHALFDVVIFDEASQIPVWDAVGAIARGKQLVCVGDPKQLPPTSFFQHVDNDDEGIDEDGTQDLESILDECLGIGLPTLGLDWHYRSRHESLIAFSNATYYDNRLITFPSPVTDDRAVRLERVRGVYDRGGSRTNRAEADAIVEAIERHYLDPESRKRSLGVVTFNQAQQILIENLLDARRRVSIKLDQAIAEAVSEPLFIKNLENVQGDERDVIYFSVTYGPDAAGKVALNFGPLNLEGGQRRLNVAVSRARQGVIIYSTLMPEQIDLSRVRATGVRDLKKYLDFAIRGPRALVEQSVPTGREPDSPFERQVIIMLREKGWTVHPQVGVSGYRIDIGVVDPRAPGRYLLGIECDGRTYHSAATARDRDRLRQIVLEDLGWELCRIWSTDWWRNPQGPMHKIIERLEALMSKNPGEPEHEVDPMVGTKTSAEESSDVYDEPVRQPAYARMVSACTDAAVPTMPDPVVASAPSPVYRRISVAGGDPDKFYESSAMPALRDQLSHIIEAEGPIADSELFRRISRAWGLARTGSRIEERLRRLVSTMGQKTKERDRTFYWPTGASPVDWAGYRVAGETEDSRRQLDEIALKEIGNLAVFVLSEHGSTSMSDLTRTICRLQHIARTSADAEARIKKALNSDWIREFVVMEHDHIRLRPYP